MLSVNAPVFAITTFCALAMPVSSAIVDLEFSGTLNLNNYSTANFFSADVGESVSGRFRFDTSVPQRNISSSPDTTIHYNAGAISTRELKFIDSEFSGLSFDFSRASDAGLDRDNFRIGPFSTDQSLNFADIYSSSVGTCGSAAGPDFCWAIQLGVLVPPGTLGIKWPQSFSLSGSQLLNDEIRFVLYNQRDDFGPTGLSSGFLSLSSLNMTAPAPVPLPASAWLLLTGLGGMIWLKRFRQAQVKRQMRNYSQAVFLVAVTGVAGCSSGNAVFKPTPLQTAENAMVYLYRPEASSPGVAKPLRFSYPEVFVDDKSFGAIEYNRYLSMELPPGEHQLKLTGLTAGAKDWEIRDIKQKVSLSPGESKFMRFRVEYNTSQMNVGQPKAQYHILLIPLAEEEALYEIRHTTPAAPRLKEQG
jgi:hypothetical protein